MPATWTVVAAFPPLDMIFALAASMIIASALSWIATWRDKRCAELGQARIAERTLHLLELCGGWPGSFAARRRYRHKTRKLWFRIVSWLCAATHVAAVVLLWRWLATGTAGA